MEQNEKEFRIEHVRIDTYKLFEPFIEEITDLQLKDFTKWLFGKLPDYWFIKPASSTGKYHPVFAQGEGGLVRHTLAMVKIWKILYRGFENDEYFNCMKLHMDPNDIGIIACIFHDALKYGEEHTFPNGLKFTTKSHDHDAADWIKNMYEDYVAEFEILKRRDEQLHVISEAIRHHMGPWSTDGAPSMFFDKLIFIADYMASSKWHEEEIFRPQFVAYTEY